jgi:hypothetical protein
MHMAPSKAGRPAQQSTNGPVAGLPHSSNGDCAYAVSDPPSGTLLLLRVRMTSELVHRQVMTASTTCVVPSAQVGSEGGMSAKADGVVRTRDVTTDPNTRATESPRRVRPRASPRRAAGPRDFAAVCRGRRCILDPRSPTPASLDRERSLLRDRHRRSPGRIMTGAPTVRQGGCDDFRLGRAQGLPEPALRRPSALLRRPNTWLPDDPSERARDRSPLLHGLCAGWAPVAAPVPTCRHGCQRPDAAPLAARQ